MNHIVLLIVSLVAYSYAFDFHLLNPSFGLRDCIFLNEENGIITQQCNIAITRNEYYDGLVHEGYKVIVQVFTEYDSVTEVRLFVYKVEGNSYQDTGIFQDCTYGEDPSGLTTTYCRDYEKYGSQRICVGSRFHYVQLSSYLKSSTL